MNHTHTPERWKTVPGYGGYYEVSDYGRVRSLGRMVQHSDGKVQPVAPRILSTPPGPYGYRCLALYRDGVRDFRVLHQLVMAVFVGPYPRPGMEIRHLDGNKDNCRLDNLKYGTCSENQYDKVRHGMHHYAKISHCKFGHELADWNVYGVAKSKYGRRQCIACSRARARILKRGLCKSEQQRISDECYMEITRDIGVGLEQAA